MPATNSRTRNTNSDKPTVNLNLDAVERDNAPEPYKFTLGGKVWIAVDPLDIDWRDLADLNVNDLRQVMKTMLPDRFDEFNKIKLPAWKVNRLAQDIIDHYGLMNLGEDNAS